MSDLRHMWKQITTAVLNAFKFVSITKINAKQNIARKDDFDRVPNQYLIVYR